MIKLINDLIDITREYKWPYSMNRPLFRARNLDPNKRIRLLVDQHDDNNNDLSDSSTKSASSNNLFVSISSTSTNPTIQQSTGSTSQLPQRCVSQMPFVSGMEREEEAEYHLQNALDAQSRLGSAKIRAVPIPDLYEDRNSQSIYPANIVLPKQLIRLQPLQLEFDEPEYDMDEIDHNWFHKTAHSLCPELTYLEYETIIDKLENASTRTRVSLDEARALFASSTPSIINDLHINTVYDFWYKRRTTRDKRLKPRLLTERDIKEEKGKHHPYVAFRRRVEKMTTRKNRKNDEQAYLSMLKLRSNFEAVVKLTNLIKLRETTKVSWLECALAIFQARCDSKLDDETTSTNQSSISSLSTNQDQYHHTRSHLKTSLLMNSNSNLTNIQHQQLLTQLIRIENQKKNSLTTSTLANLLQTSIKSRSLSMDPNDPFQRKIKKLKTSHRKMNHTDKLTQLLSSPTIPSSPIVYNMGLTSTSISPQSIFERLSSSNVVSSPSEQQTNRRRLKHSPSGIIKQGKNHRNLSPVDIWSLVDNTKGGAILLKAQFLEAARKMQQKEELENNINRRVILQDGSSVLSNTNENINNRLDEVGTSIDDEESIDPWQFRPKIGCRYLRPIDQDQQQHVQSQRSSFSSFYSLACSERGHLGKRRVRIGRGGRLLYDRHIEQENNNSMNEIHNFSLTSKSHFTDKPILWYVSSQPSLTDSYHLHSHLTVHDHTTSLAHHYQSKSSTSSSSIHLNDSFYHVNNSNPSLSLNINGKHRPSISIELDHPYSCSSRYVNQALRTLVEPQLPSPSPSPPPITSISTSQQMMVISTPPTPPPLPPLSSSSSMINNHKIDSSQQQQQPFYTKSSSTYVLSPSTPFFPSHHHSHVIPSTSPPSTPSSCGLVQFVQLHRILPPTKPHNFASSTPVTTSDS
ncbi:unnamed protein product [Rotaria sordida]|uniref:Enhancer of polycomb-like protein n=1 Tax=Rotaria sordida TaxID=392033 RepID=A0A814AZE7_9BILA|nr:unnamed protein product [Rotaria sordida]